MADLLYDLLQPAAEPGSPQPPRIALDYLTSLAGQPLSHLESVEPQYLSQTSHSLQLSLQSLSQRTFKTITASSERHASLATALPALAASAADLKAAIPKLDDAAVRFSTTYHKSADNDLLRARKTALLVARNVQRVVDLLDLPSLLSTTITIGSTNYASALDLNAHIRRLHSLYASSRLVASVSEQADEAMQLMAKNLVASLRSPGLKLASALRTSSWLRRVMPELAYGDGGLGALFLVCRLSVLVNQLEALEPLRELADQERGRQHSAGGTTWSGGQQTERYLKRYIEIFREQSFAIISMFKSIFPAQSTATMPWALSTFPLHLVEMLMETLRLYLPGVKDQPSRDSLLTQVLYCAGSLSRLGGDFGMLLASIDLGGAIHGEWVEVVRRHRLMAGRLESIVGSKDTKSLTTITSNYT